MSLDNSRLTLLALAAISTLAMVLPVNGQQPSRRGRPIQFSEPRSDVVSSNANEMRPKTTLKELEQELKKPFELLNPADDPVSRLATPQFQHAVPPAAKSRQMKELLQKRNEWMLEPEDYLKENLSVEKMFNLPEFGEDGEIRKKKTSVEKFYDNLEKARAAAQGAITNQTLTRSAEQSGYGLTEEDHEKPREENFIGSAEPFRPEVGDPQSTAKRFAPTAFSESSFSASDSRRGKSFAEFFGFASPEPALSSAEQTRALETRKQEFKDFLEKRSISPVSSSASSIDSLLNRSATPLPKLETPGFGPSSSGGGLSAAGLGLPNAGVSQLPTVPGIGNNQTLPAWQTTPPAPEPQRMKLPPAFQVPQRKF